MDEPCFLGISGNMVVENGVAFTLYNVNNLSISQKFCATFVSFDNVFVVQLVLLCPIEEIMGSMHFYEIK